MSNFVFKRDDEAAAGHSLGGKKTQSGVQTLKILAMFKTLTKNGNNAIDIVFENEKGGKAIVFNHCIDEKWTSGSENIFYGAYAQLIKAIDMQTGATAMVPRVVKGVTVQAEAFTEATGKTLDVAIQLQHVVKSDKMTEDTQYRMLACGAVGDPAIAKMTVEDGYSAEWKTAKANGTLKTESNKQAAGASAAVPSETNKEVQAPQQALY